MLDSLDGLQVIQAGDAFKVRMHKQTDRQAHILTAVL